MEEAISHDAVFKALQMLKRVRRLEGTVLLHEGILMNADTLLNERQVRDFVIEVNALCSQFRNGGRPLSRALIGFDGGNVLILNARPYTLCLLFSRLEEAESIERAAEEFLGKWSDSLQLEPGIRREFPLFEIPATGIEIPSPPPKEASPALTEPIAPVVPAAPVAVVEVAAPSLTVTAVTASLGPAREVEWAPFRQQIENLLSKVLGRAQATRLIDRELEAMGIAAGGEPAVAQFRPFGMRLIQKIKDKSLRRQIEIEFIARVEDHLS